MPGAEARRGTIYQEHGEGADPPLLRYPGKSQESMAHVEVLEKNSPSSGTMWMHTP